MACRVKNLLDFFWKFILDTSLTSPWNWLGWISRHRGNADAAYCTDGVAWCDTRQPCKTHEPVWGVKSCGPKEPCIRWGPDPPLGGKEHWGLTDPLYGIVKYGERIWFGDGVKGWALQERLNRSRCHARSSPTTTYYMDTHWRHLKNTTDRSMQRRPCGLSLPLL